MTDPITNKDGIMRRTYMVRWHAVGVPGFGSPEAAQRFIDHVGSITAPDLKYHIEMELYNGM